MNKKEKTERCREILYKKKNILPGTDDFEFLISIFQGHYNWEEKEGDGVEFISVGQDNYRKPCFYINRIDGTSTDISFVKSINNPSKVSQIKAACRTAIREEILNFKKNNVVYGKTTCVISGQVLNKDNTHIDHYDLTFNEMFNLWIGQEEINEEYLFEQIEPTVDNNFITRFKDKDIDLDFISFHNNHCKLRAVTASVNLSRGR
jgi:hypothetical protein